MKYYCEECGQEVEACSHWYQKDDIAIRDLEPLLKDVDVLGSPGWYWTAVGAGVVLFLFAATSVWRLSCRLRGIK